MRQLIGILDVVAVILALSSWGLITDVLWNAEYKLPAMAALVLTPAAFLYLAPWYDQCRRMLLSRQRAAALTHRIQGRQKPRP
jgi:hypothetical protein